jgi:nicotine blue oxidoreductase
VIRTASGDAGARDFLAMHAELVRDVPCEDVADNHDVDVPGDLPG